MTFYELKYSEDENQENPSIQNFRNGYDTDSVNSATHIHYYKKVDFRPDLDFVLDDKGKATDLLRPSFIHTNYLLISPKFFEMLKTMKLLDYQCFEAIVRNGNRPLPYYFLNFYFRFDCDENNLVDFSRTKFLASKTPFPLSIMAEPTEQEGILGEFQTSSWAEYHSIRAKKENDEVHKVIHPLSKLYIKQKEFLGLDLFYVEFNNFGSSNFIISEKLAEIIHDEGVTGVRIKPLDYEIELA